MDSQRRRHRDQVPPLDLNLADRVLSGALAPEDLPPALGPMAQAINALRPDPARTGAISEEGDRRSIDSMVAFLADSTRHPARWQRSPDAKALPRRLGGFRIRLATSLVAAGLAFLLGVAYAGRLPAPAQNAMSAVLAKIGLSVPRHHDSGGPGQNGEHGTNGDGTGGVVAPTPTVSDPAGSGNEQGNVGNGNGNETGNGNGNDTGNGNGNETGNGNGNGHGSGDGQTGQPGAGSDPQTDSGDQGGAPQPSDGSGQGNQGSDGSSQGDGS